MLSSECFSGNVFDRNQLVTLRSGRLFSQMVDINICALCSSLLISFFFFLMGYKCVEDVCSSVYAVSLCGGLLLALLYLPLLLVDDQRMAVLSSSSSFHIELHKYLDSDTLILWLLQFYCFGWK